MLSGVSIICFVGSYLVALVLEVTRLWFRSAVRGTFLLGFIAAGLLAQTAFLYYQSQETPGLPLSSPRDWCLLASWALAVLYLYLTYHYPKAHFGLFLLPLILLLIGFGTWVADPKPFPRGPASQVWGIIHGVSILAASVSVIFGFVSGLMYLMQSRRLKQKKMPRRGLLLPSLEWLQRINSRSIIISTVLLGIGVVSGGILIRLGGEASIPWSDPVIVTTIALFIWLLGASIIATFYHPAREGRKVAYLTVVNFVFLAVGLILVFGVDTEHGGRRVSKKKCPGGAQYFSQGRSPWKENDFLFFFSNTTSGEAARGVAEEAHAPEAAPLAKLLSVYPKTLSSELSVR